MDPIFYRNVSIWSLFLKKMLNASQLLKECHNWIPFTIKLLKR